MLVDTMIMRRDAMRSAQREQDAAYRRSLAKRMEQKQREAERLGAALFNRPAGAPPLGFAQDISMRARFRELNEQIRELRYETTGRFR